MTGYKPKLIEVALPLATINAEAAREKSIRHGHPSTLHLWWARRPLAAARAVIWASLVDDPSGDETLTGEQQEKERQRLFGILERLVKWEASNDQHVLDAAKAEIDRCYPDGPPPILDPFGGGGSIPLEAQRLGLTALSGDLNPVAVLIQKAMIEIPPRFASLPPVHPDIQTEMTTWEGAQGLSVDIEAYGNWMRDEAQRLIGHHYPDATGPDGSKLPPIAWIWARTVKSPDPSWNGEVPLVGAWTLAKRKGRPTVWVEPQVNRASQTITYNVKEGGAPQRKGSVDRGGGVCVATGAAIPFKYIREEGLNGRHGRHLMAVVADGDPGRVYCAPNNGDESAAAVDCDLSLGPLPENPRDFKTPGYGLDRWEELFSPRQLMALQTLTDLLEQVWSMAEEAAARSGMSRTGARLHEGGCGSAAYADAVVTYLAFAIDKCADYWSTIAGWDNTKGETVRNTFGRQAIPMTWNYVEANPFSTSTGSLHLMLKAVAEAVSRLPAAQSGQAVQRDARSRVVECSGASISTDPPYYDNISYADLSDFFFVWLRRSLASVWPDECATLATPKNQELIANPYRAGSKGEAEQHFESGMAEFMAEVAKAQPPNMPATIYYAYKATETKEGEVRSTGWDTFLQAVLDAGMQVNATWPMRTELGNRLLASKTNALASSIVLACRPRPATAALASRGEFVSALRQELPDAVRLLQSGNIAPVDMAQSTIGPGIKVFSRYAKVVEADGSSMSVSAALSIINDVLGEVLDGEEAELDSDTRFASTWFAQHGYNPASSGEADGLARAKNTSLAGLEDAGVGEARGGKFRLFERSELDEDWSPVGDNRLTVWEATQHLVAALERSESEAAALLHQLGGYADRARQLAYVLFQKATDSGWADEAGAYNSLITAWPALQGMRTEDDGQTKLL
jgi:putative DNA methylase